MDNKKFTEHLNKSKYWIKDYAYLFWQGTKMYLRNEIPKHYLEHTTPNKAPVIILAGVFGRWTFLKPLADYISLKGHPVYVVPKLGNNTDNIPTSSKEVTRVIKENKLKDVVIVAHSKGGLIGKYLLLKDDSKKSVKGVVAIATPFHGSLLGKVVTNPTINELSTDSEVVKYLEEHLEVNDRIISVMPVYDNLVLHEKGSFLEGALENITIEVPGHHLILNNKEVWEKTLLGIERISRL